MEPTKFHTGKKTYTCLTLRLERCRRAEGLAHGRARRDNAPVRLRPGETNL